MAIQTFYRTVQDVKGTNTTRIKTGTDGTMVAQILLSAHLPEAPVVDEEGRFVGLVSESGLLEVIESGRELRSIKVEEIMSRKLHFVHEATPIDTALTYIEKNHLLNLPVVEDGYLIKTISLHDLLRAVVDAGLGLE